MAGLPSSVSYVYSGKRGDTASQANVLGADTPRIADIPVALADELNRNAADRRSHLDFTQACVAKKLPDVSSDMIASRETENRCDPPDKPRPLCALLTGDLYQILVTFKAYENCAVGNTEFAGLDTCGGCNLIRPNQMPLNAIMREVRTTSSIYAAQGQRLEVLGVTTLFISVGNSRDMAAVDSL
jgi:hypothetical protein